MYIVCVSSGVCATNRPKTCTCVRSVKARKTEEELVRQQNEQVLQEALSRGIIGNKRLAAPATQPDEARAPVPESHTVLVKWKAADKHGTPPAYSEHDLRQEFASYGFLHNVVVLPAKRAALLEFSAADAAQRALAHVAHDAAVTMKISLRGKQQEHAPSEATTAESGKSSTGRPAQPSARSSPPPAAPYTQHAPVATAAAAAAAAAAATPAPFASPASHDDYETQTLMRMRAAAAVRQQPPLAEGSK